MNDAYVSALGKGRIYRYRIQPMMQASKPLAQIAGGRAAYVAARALYGKHEPFDSLLMSKFTEFLNKAQTQNAPPDADQIREGQRIGDVVAGQLLAVRELDRHREANPEEYSPPRALGMHDLDPVSMNRTPNGDPVLYAERWGLVEPFVLNTQDIVNFRPPAPPALNSKDYRNSLNQVRNLGRRRARDYNDVNLINGLFWAYDGANKIGTPPRLYNDIVRRISDYDKLTEEQNIELFTLCNLSMADAGIQAWDAKYFYYFWRPVVGIRKDPLEPESSWEPVGAPDSNDPTGTDFTPPFPAYPSGHATFGAACFETVKLYRKRVKNFTLDKADKIDIDFVSDEINDVTTEAGGGTARPKRAKNFKSLDSMIQANLDSRVQLGVHWDFDGISGADAGRKIAMEVEKRGLSNKAVEE
jgi:hypothetical protein